jgi:acyl carrier protein
MDAILVETQIEHIIECQVGHCDWQRDMTWNELGLDSMEIVLVFHETEKNFGVGTIRENEMEDILTPNDLIKFIKDRI